MLCAIELFGVEWVGDRDPVLFQLAPLLGSLFVAVVAAYAARLAAITANKRHREQLEHDAERQRKQLAHDTERQREELAHDRDMRSLEHARDAVDKAMELADQVHTRIQEVLSSVDPLESHRIEFQETFPHDDVASDRKAAEKKALRRRENEFREELIDARRGMVEMHSAGFGLSLRLGAAHPLRGKYRDLVTARSELLNALAVSRNRQQDADEKAALKNAHEKANRSYAELIGAGEAWLQSQSVTQS